MTTGLSLKDLEQELKTATTDWDRQSLPDGAALSLAHLGAITTQLKQWLDGHFETLRESPLYKEAASLWVCTIQKNKRAMIEYEEGLWMPIKDLTHNGSVENAQESHRTLSLLNRFWHLDRIWQMYTTEPQNVGPSSGVWSKDDLVKDLEQGLEKAESVRALSLLPSASAVLTLAEQRANQQRSSELIALGKLQALYFKLDKLYVQREAAQSSREAEPGAEAGRLTAPPPAEAGNEWW